MYSRDVFPRYSSGGLPIPENYSGNAIRRTPTSQGSGGAGNRNSAGNRGMGGTPTASGRSTGMGSGSPRVHTPSLGGAASDGGRKSAGGERVRAAEVPLTVSPTFSPSVREEVPSEARELHGSMQGEQVPPFVMPFEEGAGGGEDAPPDGDGFRGGGAEDGSSLGREADSMPTDDGERDGRRGEGVGKGEEEKETVTASAHSSGGDGGGFSALLSTLLPPKPEGFGALSQIGLEEALLLGLFLLLSQSESEDDTLMLLALLFLYR